MSDPAIDILHWYVAMGVDMAIDEVAHDRFAESALADQSQSASVGQEAWTGQEVSARQSTIMPPRMRTAPVAAPTREVSGFEANSVQNPLRATETAVALAQTNAQAAQNLDELRAALENFDECGLKRTAHHLIFSDGNPQADLVLIGEAPNADEDRAGMAFVGETGHLLDQMLAAIGHSRSSTYLMHVVPWRPPGNRAPNAQEIAMCLPFLQRHLELLAPKVVVCLGAVSVQAVLQVREPVTRVRGQWYEVKIGDALIPALATLHPAFLVRQPASKRMAWADLRALAQKYPAPNTSSQSIS